MRWSDSGSEGSTSPNSDSNDAGIDLVARHVLDREAHEPAAHPRHRAHGRVHDLVQRDVEAEVFAGERPRRLERVDVGDDEA